MSAHAIDRSEMNVAPAGRDKRPGLARLTKVELSKMVISNALQPAGILLPVVGILLVDWINSAEALEPLTTTVMSGHEWAQGLVALALWMGVPLAIGLWQLTRGDVG